MSSEPGDAAHVEATLRQMHVWLLAGYAADAVSRAAAVTELALRVVAGLAPDSGVELGALIDELRRRGRIELLADASWLYQLRIATEQSIGRVCPDRDHDGRRAAEIATRFALAAGLVTESRVTASETSAAWQASQPTSSTLLRLDRATHRKVLDDMLALPPRVLVVLVHGEVDQGHDHFAAIMTWRLRSASSGWREIAVKWPPPSPSLGHRLGMLLEELACGLGLRLSLPTADPTTACGALTWTSALGSIANAIDANRERVLVRHVLRWLSTGPGGDDALVEAYVRTIWERVAAHAGDRVVVGFDLRRIERAGLPLSRTWRIARTERAAARAIEAFLDRHHMPNGGLCIALPELTSVPVPDLIDWLRAQGGRTRDAARAEASKLVLSTRGGRFDLVVDRLIALNLDRQRDST